jgi:hypothetical protein|uniref:Uncharacterized protein n=1 Tax=viral metagenome TaxID=1070528 RepID=A0A6C0BYS3_9ZZZZ
MRRSKLNLMGENREIGLKLSGKRDMMIEKLDIDYLDFKMSIMDNFLEPLLNSDVETVQKNQYNFDYIISRLNFYKNDTNSDEILLMQKVVDLMKNATNARVSYSNMYQRIYGSRGLSMNRMIFETSRIILKAPFEIYDTLFGIKENQKYNMDIIREIEKILEAHPGIMFDDIKKKIELLNFVLDE